MSRLLGFLRLAVPRRNRELSEIDGSALIRELHVYGVALALGDGPGDGAQHRGLGRRLLGRAEELARMAGCTDLAVISAVGTREYYRRRGFGDGALYQHRTLG